MRLRIDSGWIGSALGLAGSGVALTWPDQNWAGLAMIGAAVLVALFGVRIDGWHIRVGRPRRVMGPLIVMSLGAAIFMGGAVWYLWPSQWAKMPAAGGASPGQLHKPWKHSLEELYSSDFTDILNAEQKWNITVSNPSQGLNPMPAELRYRLHQDFRGNTDFVSLFIPALDGRVDFFGLVKWLRDEIPPMRDGLYRAVGVGSSGPGVPYVEAKELKPSGRVFIYTMHNFTVVQLGDLTRWYEDKGMALQIRGPEYWTANRDR